MAATFAQRGRIAGRRIIAAIEPWYHWGRINIERYDTVGRDGRDGIEGEVRFFDLQWFGLHFGVQIGRLPRPEGR